jgi:hypothetical protein
MIEPLQQVFRRKTIISIKVNSKSPGPVFHQQIDAIRLSSLQVGKKHAIGNGLLCCLSRDLTPHMQIKVTPLISSLKFVL